jgi:hypothetical protein
MIKRDDVSQCSAVDIPGLHIPYTQWERVLCGKFTFDANFEYLTEPFVNV